MTVRRGGRYKWKVNTKDDNMRKKIDKLATSTSASVRVDMINLAKWCELAASKDMGFRSVSQAVGSALDTLIEVLVAKKLMEDKEVSLEGAWTWLEHYGLIQQQMIRGRGRGVGKSLLFESMKDEGYSQELIDDEFHRSYAQSNRAHMTFNPIEEELGIVKIEELPAKVNNKRKDEFKFEQSRKDEFRAWFNKLELEEKAKLVNDGNYSGEVYHKIWDHFEDDGEHQTSIDWNERLEAFQLFILGAMHAWKMIEEMKPYTDENGIINPPSTFFEEQARTIAEIEKANKEYAEKFAQEQAKKALEKEEKRKAKELLKLNEKIANAEQEHHAIVNKLRKDETSTGAD